MLALALQGEAMEGASSPAAPAAPATTAAQKPCFKAKKRGARVLAFSSSLIL